MGHADKAEQESAGFGGSQPGAGRPPLPSPSQVARELIEENVAIILRPHFRALGYDVETGDQGVVLIPLEGGGAKLYGESREGIVKASDHEDLGAQMAAADKLLDRIYGRPKQATELSGPGGGGIPVTGAAIPDESDWHEAVLRLGGQVANGNGHPVG